MKYQQVIDILIQAKTEISALLNVKDDEHHRLKLEADLQRNITYLSLLTGATDTEVVTADKMGPATTIAGQPIVTNNKVKPADLQPSQERLQVLKNKIETAYAEFLTTETYKIKTDWEENVIRGVAKKAKMKVTKEDPEIITLDFIEEIKQNIIEMDQRDSKNQQEKERVASTETAGPTQPLEPEHDDVPKVTPELTKTPADQEVKVKKKSNK